EKEHDRHEKFKAAQTLSSGGYIKVREQRRSQANAEIRSGFRADFSNILLEMSVEDGLKMIISGGVVVPPYTPGAEYHEVSVCRD
ncbi:MAG: hypothetical protein PWQ96_1203, partial [Clostridia bacterium]|nr:hypothetical protein [Clostridia bacterium]